MSVSSSDLARISAEYGRRARELPADFYSWSKPANLLLHQQTMRGCVRMLHRAALFPLKNSRILDVGCGNGTWLLEFMQWGADPSALCGIDLLPERLQGARHRIPQADIRAGSASELPWPDESFDLVSQFTVFTSILDPTLKQDLASEMLRVLRPGGSVLWFDFRVSNPSNPHVRGIGAAEIRRLFAGCEVELSSVLLAPPLARLITKLSWPLAECLHAVPLLRTHYAGLIRKKR
jgi:ubiquinone/menaquinone biosynthesis C-methylase UbiE